MPITTTPITRYLISDDDAGFDDVLLREGAVDEDCAAVVIAQGKDRILLTIDHAKAVNAALSELLGVLAD